MNLKWTAGMDPSEAKIMETEYNGSKAVRDRLATMLQKEIAARQKKGRSEIAYESPNWQYLQADVNGATRAIEHIISLLK
jgi:hypothetical protein